MHDRIFEFQKKDVTREVTRRPILCTVKEETGLSWHREEKCLSRYS